MEILKNKESLLFYAKTDVDPGSVDPSRPLTPSRAPPCSGSNGKTPLLQRPGCRGVPSYRGSKALAY